jgi:hypothetical protein
MSDSPIRVDAVIPYYHENDSIKLSWATSCGRWLNVNKTNVPRMEMVLKMLVLLPYSHLTWLVAREFHRT